MLSKADMDKLKEHSKLHKGGMSGRHMKNMKKFMENGDSFAVAHNKAKELDKKMNGNGKKMAKPESGKNGEKERNKKIQAVKMSGAQKGKSGLTTKQKKNLPPALKEAIKKKKAETKPKKRKVMNNPNVGRMGRRSGY